MLADLWRWVAAQWPAAAAFVLAFLLVVNRIAEESAKFAKFFGPIGRRVYERAQNRYQSKLDPTSIAEAIEVARREWEADENDALVAVNRRLDVFTELTSTQTGEIAELQKTIRVLTAYTVYDARWHQVFSISNPAIDVPIHLDWLQFEQKYNADPNGAWRTDIIRAQAIATQEQQPR